MEKALKKCIVWGVSVGFGQNCHHQQPGFADIFIAVHIVQLITPMLAVKNNTEWLSWDYSGFKLDKTRKLSQWIKQRTVSMSTSTNRVAILHATLFKIRVQNLQCDCAQKFKVLHLAVPTTSGLQGITCIHHINESPAVCAKFNYL